MWIWDQTWKPTCSGWSSAGVLLSDNHQEKQLYQSDVALTVPCKPGTSSKSQTLSLKVSLCRDAERTENILPLDGKLVLAEFI